MHFAFTDDQLAFRDAVRDLLERECPATAVRAAWTNDTGRTPTAWAHLAAMGVLGVLAPEAAGGLGLSVVDLVLVLEETGYAALPEPIVEHAAVAVPILEDPRPAAAGQLTVTAALDGSGRAAWADTADLIICPGDTGAPVLARADVTLERCPSVDGARRLFTVTPTGAPDRRSDPRSGRSSAARSAPPRSSSGSPAGCSTSPSGTSPNGASSASRSGRSRRSSTTSPTPASRLEFARPLVYRAAWSLAHDDPDAALHVSMAKAQASDAAHRAGRQALQCHGAIGYSYEYDLHLYLKRAWALAATWGDARWHRARVGRAILGSPQRRSPDA